MTISDTDNPLSQFEGPNRVFLRKVIVDTSNEDIYKDFADRLSNYGSGYYFLKEVWLSDKVDVVTFMRVLNDGMKNPIWSDSYYYYHSTMSLAGDATLCVPAKQGEAVRALMARHAKFPPYTVRTYTGNVAEAQKIGLKATKNPCSKHNFVAKICTADRQVQYYTCTQDPKVYYSCSICGQCERNPKHTFQFMKQEEASRTRRAFISLKPTLLQTRLMWAPMPLASISTGRAASGAACLTTMSSAILPRSTAAWLVLTGHWPYSVNTWRLS